MSLVDVVVIISTVVASFGCTLDDVIVVVAAAAAAAAVAVAVALSISNKNFQ